MHRLPRIVALFALASSLIGQAAPRPNLILILADDIGVECFGCYGGTSWATPQIDRLAAQGMRFTQCHAQPLCTPTRVKLMTGKSNARNYVAFSVLPRGERTFAHLLKDAGYATAVVGKWQLYGSEQYPEGQRGAGTLPEDAGFERHCLWQVERLGSRYRAPTLRIDGKTETFGDDIYGPDVFTRYALDFIEQHREGPFLLYFPMALVHNPFEPTPRSEDRKAPRGRRHFADMVAYMDAIVGHIVRKVDELGIASRTLVLFAGDNGTNRNIRSQQGGRTIAGGKGLTTDAGTHVPLVAWWPGTVAPGSTCGDLVDFSDFLPSFCELAGIPRDRLVLDGRSFVPQLRGERGDPRETLTMYYWPRPRAQPRSRPVRFARDQRYKLYARGALFDLVTDPREQRPLSGDDEALRAVRERLQRALAAMPRRDG